MCRGVAGYIQSAAGYVQSVAGCVQERQTSMSAWVKNGSALLLDAAIEGFKKNYKLKFLMIKKWSVAYIIKRKFLSTVFNNNILSVIKILFGDDDFEDVLYFQFVFRAKTGYWDVM